LLVKYVTAGLLLVGVTLFGGILYQTGLTAIWTHLREIGWWGIAVILLVNVFITLADVASWQLTLPSTQPAVPWMYRLWKVFLVGEAISETTPLASLGGEPIKATLLHEHYGISYREATASLLLHQTAINVGLMLFLLSSVPLIFQVQTLPPAYQWWSSVVLITFSSCIWLFFLVQRYRAVSRVSAWVGRNGLGRRLPALLDVVRDIENQLVAFYTKHRRHFALTVALAWVRWILGVAETYYILVFLGHPVTVVEAWVIEAVVSLVRAALFVIPANLGTQEGSLFVMCELVTGVPALGVAAALLHRFREIVWIGGGLAIGWGFSLKPPTGGSPASKVIPRATT
jgi:uncharacterized protein (TIRG00374 family)